MPEADVILAQAVLYLAKAPKSRAVNDAMARATALVERTPNFRIPMHLRNAPTKLMKEIGYGRREEEQGESNMPVDFQGLEKPLYRE